MRRLILLAILAGCDSEPFAAPNNRTRDPFDPGPPARLTVNGGTDYQISFTPDGRYLLYTMGDNGLIPRGCLGFLPVHEARDSAIVCPVPSPRDTVSYFALTLFAVVETKTLLI